MLYLSLNTGEVGYITIPYKLILTFNSDLAFEQPKSNTQYFAAQMANPKYQFTYFCEINLEKWFHHQTERKKKAHYSKFFFFL